MTRKTSDELAEIAAWLNVSGVRVAVHSDPVDGWHPMVIGAPAAAGKHRPLADGAPSICGGPTT